jgi:hypothetical protein
VCNTGNVDSRMKGAFFPFRSSLNLPRIDASDWAIKFGKLACRARQPLCGTV